MSTGTGTQTDPIVAMSADPAQIVRDVRASMAHYSRIDDAYWIEKAGTPAEFSNHLWHLGWNRYWEVRADPANTGSADPALGREPAKSRAPFEPMPTPNPIPTPPEPVEPDDGGIDFDLVAFLARLNELEANIQDVKTLLTDIKNRPWPTYTGKLLGYPITLTEAKPKDQTPKAHD